MELHTWLDDNPGRATWLADQLGCTKGAVSLWRDEGVPMLRMQRIEELTGGQVTVDAMFKHAVRCKTTKATAA
jgi:hypothetical protein